MPRAASRGLAAAQTGAGGAGAAGGPGCSATGPLRPAGTLTEIGVEFRPAGGWPPQALEAGIRRALRLRSGNAPETRRNERVEAFIPGGSTAGSRESRPTSCRASRTA